MPSSHLVSEKREWHHTMKEKYIRIYKCCKTNIFVFRFSEATITLEDIMVLRGYPVVGDQ